jgi:hypothetical protein
MWLHVQRRPLQPGPTRFNLLWYYEPIVRLEGLRHRTVRASYSSAVLPSLQLSAGVVAGLGEPGSFLLRLQALNLQGLESFTLRGISCTGGGWSISQLDAGAEAGSSVDAGAVLGPEGAATLHYLLWPTAAVHASAAGAAVGSVGAAAPPRALSDVELFLAEQEGRGVDRRTSMAGAGHHNHQQQHQQQQQQLQSRATPARDVQLKQHGPLTGRLDLAVQWEAVAQPGTPPHRGLSTLRGIRWGTGC